MVRKLKNIFLVSWIFPGKADSVILLGFEYTTNPQNLMKIEILNFFLCELPLILKVGLEIFVRALDIELEQDWSVGLGSTLGDGKKVKNIFLVSGIFSGKFTSITLLGFECTINPQNLIKIVGAIFEKINFFNFFSYVNYP